MTDDANTLNEHELIYDWNLVDLPKGKIGPVEFDDETLRDGVQSPSIKSPTIEEKKQILHLMADLGIQSADIGLPGAGPHVKEDVVELATEIARHKLAIEPNCAARTVIVDIDPIIEAVQRSGIPIEASLFIGTSPIRQYVEDWTLDQLLKLSEDAITYAVKAGLEVMFVTEDTNRAQPETLRKIYTTAIECGARRICLADTVGHSTPHGVRQLVTFMKKVVADTGEDVKIDWHGHRDRGLGLYNTITAAEAGANRLHACALGVGERCGNTTMEHLLVNLKLMGVIDNDLSKLSEYCELVSKVCDVPIPFNHPIIGRDAYRTSTGVHAAAVIKAIKSGHQWLADQVYSGVPASWTGRQQEIEIGPMSGASNVIYWLQSRDIEPDDALVEKLFEAAKNSNRVLPEKTVWAMVKEYQGKGKDGEANRTAEGK
ncbi:MAG: LeuA family protein [Candidatus Latescibacterota bacterium]|jgi:2-isopropylmalate synthase